MRPLMTLLALAFLGGCSNLQQEAQDSLLSTLPDRRGVTYDNVSTYPGNVVCGDYTASSVMGYNKRTRPFIYHEGRVFNQPSADEVAIYCTKEPVEALQERLGIGPMTTDNHALQQVYRDMTALDDALEAHIENRGDLPDSPDGLDMLTHPRAITSTAYPLIPGVGPTTTSAAWVAGCAPPTSCTRWAGTTRPGGPAPMPISGASTWAFSGALPACRSPSS